MDDLISRQEAINAVKNIMPTKEGFYEPSEVLCELMVVPVVQLKRKTGFWIPQDLNKSSGMLTTAVYYYPRCSLCGSTSNYTNYCPNCGADMRGEQDG